MKEKGNPGSFGIAKVFLVISLFLIDNFLISNSLHADIFTLVDNDSLGLYNDSLGTVLDRTNAYLDNYLFPGADLIDGDPTFEDVPEPVLDVAESILGSWLDNPPVLNANWIAPQTIPMSWAINTETAIIYSIDGGQTGIQDVVANIGADNGFFIWLDGVYKYGALSVGGAYASVPLGNLEEGTHYLQILREDHGVSNGFTIEVTGVPEPGTICLLGLGGLAVMRRRRA